MNNVEKMRSTWKAARAKVAASTAEQMWDAHKKAFLRELDAAARKLHPDASLGILFDGKQVVVSITDGWPRDTITTPELLIVAKRLAGSNPVLDKSTRLGPQVEFSFHWDKDRR